jgi:predicted O-methyltransferase YrrM
MTETNYFSRLVKAAKVVFRQPRHFFRMCEQETENLAWAERFKALSCIPEVRLTDLLQVPEIALETITFRAGGSSVPDYVLLAGLCQQYPACNYLEIGTFLGESIANVAPFCERCVSLSLNDEEFATTEALAADARRVSRMFSKSLTNVKHLYGDSSHYDFGQISERFDVIFVDGCHDYPSVVSDTQNAIKLLRSDESVIVFHDAKSAYNEIEPEVLVGIHDGLPPDWRKHLYTVANTLCAVAIKRPMKPFERVSLKENPYSKPTLKFGLRVRINEIG